MRRSKLRLASQPNVRHRRDLTKIAMHYVYLLRSEANPKQQYVGLTSDLKHRLAEHNRGDSPHTSKFIPWAIRAYFAFPKQTIAIAFERYLKSGSGRAFAKRHFG